MWPVVAIFRASISSRTDVAAIRVMLGEMPAMLRGILEEIFSHQRDMMLVGPSDAVAVGAVAVAAYRPDVLVVSPDESDWATSYAGLFGEQPRLRILAIRDDARSATMSELYVRRWRVADLAPDAVLAAVRAACAGANAEADAGAHGGD